MPAHISEGSSRSLRLAKRSRCKNEVDCVCQNREEIRKGDPKSCYRKHRNRTANANLRSRRNNGQKKQKAAVETRDPSLTMCDQALPGEDCVEYTCSQSEEDPKFNSAFAADPAMFPFLFDLEAEGVGGIEDDLSFGGGRQGLYVLAPVGGLRQCDADISSAPHFTVGATSNKSGKGSNRSHRKLCPNEQRCICASRQPWAPGDPQTCRTKELGRIRQAKCIKKKTSTPQQPRGRLLANPLQLRPASGSQPS